MPIYIRFPLVRVGHAQSRRSVGADVPTCSLGCRHCPHTSVTRVVCLMPNRRALYPRGRVVPQEMRRLDSRLSFAITQATIADARRLDGETVRVFHGPKKSRGSPLPDCD